MRDARSHGWTDIARPVELRTRELASLTALPGQDAVAHVLVILNDLHDIFTSRGGRAGAAAACFNRLYIGTTAEIGKRLAAGEFLAPSFICALDVQFALRYLAAVRGMATDATAVPRSWRVVFDPEVEASAMARTAAGVNAHINFDLPFALLAALRDVAVFPAGPRRFVDRDGEAPSAEYRDYVEVNEIFHALLPGALEFTTGHDVFLRWLYRLGAVQVDAELLITAARRMAWLVCENHLWSTPALDPRALRRREDWIDWLVSRMGAEMLGPSGHLAFGGPEDAVA